MLILHLSSISHFARYTAPSPLVVHWMDILNKTFTSHRMKVVVQPPAPPILSQRLRDYLVGDTVRGVQVSADDGLVGDAGALISVDWKVTDDPDNTHCIELAYEKSTYLAYLILPRSLLLIHATAPIRNAVIGFLSQTLDARASPLIPDSAALVYIFETWLGDGGGSARKDVVITLGFGGKAAGGGLRSVDIATPAGDVAALVDSGGHERFSDKLASYVDKHLALDMNHSDVRILRITCGGFALGEGKVRVLEENAVNTILDRIK